MSGAPHWLAFAEEAFVPADSGGRVESLNMLRAATAAGIRLHVVVPGLPPDAAAVHRGALPGAKFEAIPRRTGWRSHAALAPYLFVSRPMPPRLLPRLADEHAADPYDAVLAVSFRVAHLGVLAARALDLPLVVRPHNIESEYFAELARGARFPRDLPYRAEAWKLLRAERALHAERRIALFADIAERDAARRRQVTRTPVVHLPPFLPPAAPQPVAVEKEAGPPRVTVLFLGALDGPHNREGIVWFVQQCWPLVRAEVPDAELHVVGRRGAPDLVARLRAAGARVTVDAPDVAPHLRAAAVFVNPVQHGAGVNIKVVEAMAAGVPVVSTPTGSRGLHWRDGEQLVVVDDRAAFARAVAGLLREPARRVALGAAGRRFVTEELDGVRQINRMREALVRPEPLS